MTKSSIAFIILFLFQLTVNGEINKFNRISKTDKELSDYKIQKKFKTQSVLASGKWFKISTTEQGIHKISYTRLKEFGITNPSNIAIYGNGGFELPKSNAVDYPDDLSLIPVIHQKDKNGTDCIYFYSPGNVKWEYNENTGVFIHDLNSFTDTTYFFISSDLEKSPIPSINKITTNTPEKYLSEYDELRFLEQEKDNMIASGRNWYGEKLSSMSKRIFSFDFPNAIQGTKSSASLSFIGRSFDKSRMYIKINDTPLDTAIYDFVYRDEETLFAREYINTLSFNTKDVVRIETYFDTNNQWGEAWLDYISLNVRCKLIFDSEQFTFRNKDVLQLSSAGYSISTQNKNMLVWDITNPLNPESVNTFDTGTGIVNIYSTGNEIRNFVAFDPLSGTFPDETKIKSVAIANQNIHGLPSHDMVIITHPDFLIPSEELAQFHRDNDNMKVLVVTINEVYNEFSSGSNDLTAIRNMMRMFYSRSAESENPLKYLLLMGDGSYDNRKFDVNKSNLLPTYQSENSLNPVVTLTSDDYFGFLDDDEYELTGDLDIGIGRIPCGTIDEAESTINKIFLYSSSKSLGDWRNVVCFIADDEDINFANFSEDLINIISENYPGFYADKIYFDSYKQVSTSGGNRYPEVTEAINKRVEEGALILNYIGHANPSSLAHENVLGINDIKSWKNSVSLPIFVTATCQFGRFDQDEVSAGEQILLNPTGGGVGLFTTTRVVYAGDNQEISEVFYHNIFNFDEKGEKLRLGDIFKNAKNGTSDGINKHKFSLFADPALKLAFPKYSIRTISINGIDVSQNEINIGALEKVDIKAEIVDHNGNKINDFNGEVTTTIFDKEITVRTLGNDGSPTVKYPVQNNVIFKGVNLVQNGEFEFSFIVPKDITYNTGKGKILYYASDGTNDANGSYSNIGIGGTGTNPIIESNPPEINLFLNNENFKPDDVVNTNSLLIVNLFDDSGINTVGAGIGHDIIAVLDGKYSNQIILNEYYSSETNSFQSGKIIYPLNDLEPGPHTISVKVWDIQNNSSEKEITFIVEDGFKITGIKNSPNPITYYTDFQISHNLPGEIFDATVQIYNLRGQKIDEITETISSAGKTEVEIRWDIFQTDYPIYTDQILIYRVELTNEENVRASKSGKILINFRN